MTAYDDETLMRRVDGELSPEAGAALDAAAAADPVLAGRLAALRSLRTLAREAVPVAPDPRDQALARLIAAAPAKQPLGPRLADALRDAFQPRRAPLWAGLAAACFVAGLSLGWLGGGQADGGFTVGDHGALAEPGLVRVLDARLTADGPDAEGRAVGLTFRDADGRWCRTFHAGQARLAGLACREGEGWILQALAPAAPPAAGLRAAAADIPAPVLAAVDAVIAGQTLDAPAEARVRDAGWR
ncbi:hypothetical protein [Brevundimonas sp.]|uniref:hypothetical protein n=1 Tax=Brevundimonas sp. TaxID=1871086 RepID=UPI002737C8FA|nr:hypothetical protein [Brevundimonas sp.]MDP3801400.1 hypothetical protein [Brevundimonas sp.]